MDRRMSGAVIIGAGGHARCVIDTMQAAGVEIAGVVDVTPDSEVVLGVPVIGGDAELANLRAAGLTHAVMGIGSVGDATIRRQAAARALDAGFTFDPVAHPSAVVSAHASLARGAYVGAGAVIGPGATIGEFAIVNSSAVVDHDCAVGAFAHVAPGAVLAGTVTVGDDAHVGAGAAVIQGRTIGASAIVGAGSVVTKDIPEGETWLGNPARARQGHA